MKTIRLRLFVAALAVLLGSVIAKSQAAEDAAPAPPPNHGPEFGMRHMVEFLTKRLDLTEAQQAQAKAIIDKEHPVMKPLMEQSHQIDQQLHQYEEGTYDESKVRSLARQQAKVQVELTVQRTRIHNELFQILTPEQQAKMKELEADRESRMRQHMDQNSPPAEE